MRYIILSATLGLYLLVEFYCYRLARSAWPGRRARSWVRIGYGLSLAVSIHAIVLVAALGSARYSLANAYLNISVGLFFAFFVAKFFLVLVLLPYDGMRLLSRGLLWMKGERPGAANGSGLAKAGDVLESDAPDAAIEPFGGGTDTVGARTAGTADTGANPVRAAGSVQDSRSFPAEPSSRTRSADAPATLSRRSFVARMGLAVAAVPFLGFIDGVARGRYAFRVKRITLAFPDLPSAFDGLRILQLSDLHLGSFDDMRAVRKGFAMAQDEGADLILFTGDLVNNFAEEAEPYRDLLSDLHAPMGKYAVLGNHDYGEYVTWDTDDEKRANFEHLVSLEKEVGFTLLRNEHRRLERDGQSIVLAGVENWGLHHHPAHGDLDKAMAGVEGDDFTLLMSHDPSHWDARVRPFAKTVQLTLSGHTHGFQVGVELPGFRWSPVQYVYKQWAGLYREAREHLYINRGFGYIGFPGRVGIWPEITLLELRRG